MMNKISQFINLRSIHGFIRGNREIVSLYSVVFLMFLIPSVLSPSFRGANNFTNIFNQIAPIGFVALGQTFVIITTGIDISVGSVISLTTAIVSSNLASRGLIPFVFAIELAILSAADAVSPIGDEPMWKTVYNGAAGIPAMMQAHEDAARERDAVAFRDEKTGGLRPLFGQKGYVETGLPKGPIFGRIEDQIRQGERDLEGWKPPQVSIPRYRVR